MDWLDPNTWKLPAELIGYAQAIIVGIVAIIGAIATIFLKPLRWLRSRFKKKGLSFVQNDLTCTWIVAKLNDQSEPATLVHGG